MKKEELASLFVIKINELIETDQFAMDQIFSYRVIANKELLKLKIPLKKINKKYKIGIVSVLNYIIGTIDEGPHKGRGYISIVCNKKGDIIRVERTDLLPSPIIKQTKSSISKLQTISSSLVNNFFKRLK